jgi:glyoxylase-like metal-dependent hydrolase (beta-lactamase superfamily II)
MGPVMSNTGAPGLSELGGGCYGYFQPDGSWGLSNAGLVVDGDESLLVDTLFDRARTEAMLRSMRAAEPRAAARIGTVVNTHHNGDHCFGNEVVEGAEFIASEAAARAMVHEPPALLHGFLANAPHLGPLGEYLLHCFGKFDFGGIRQVLPTRTFTGRLDHAVGGKVVQIVEVGPAHSPGDVIVHVPASRLVFTGDVLFVDVHPVMWAGPVGGWLAACKTILGLEVDTIVPGHGPLTDKQGVRALMRYLEYVRDEAKKRFDAGLALFDAAADIAFTDWSAWGDAERIVVNVAAVYRELAGDASPPDVAALFGMMARLRQVR